MTKTPIRRDELITLIAKKFASARHDALRFGDKHDDTSRTDVMVAGIDKAARYVSDAFAGLDPAFDRDEFLYVAKGSPTMHPGRPSEPDETELS
jgi:hypothetical protein